LNDSLLLGEVGSSDSESGRGNDWQTDGNTNNEEDKGVVEQVDGGVLWGGNVQVVEETADPCNQDEEDDQNQERRADAVHDSLEVTLVLGTRDERSSATDEGHLGGVGDEGISLSTLATSCVVDGIGDVLVDSERFSGHGRLINGKKSVAGAVLLSHLIVIALLVGRLASLSFQLAEIFLVTVGVVVGRDNARVGWDDLSILNDDLEND
jgi:hypothetical protein